MLDISGRNIAFCCTNLLNKTEEELFEVLGYPDIEPLSRLDGTPLETGLPKQLVKAAEWVEWIDEDDEDIRLLDFGESFLQGEEPEQLSQPGTLRVPEMIFTRVFDYRVDLWRVGCMVSCHPYVFYRTCIAIRFNGLLILDLFLFIHNIPILVSWRG